MKSDSSGLLYNKTENLNYRKSHMRVFFSIYISDLGIEQVHKRATVTHYH